MNQSAPHAIRKILTGILLFISTWSSGQIDFSRVDVSTDSTYGYTDTNPLKMKKGNFEKSIGYSFDFLQGLKTIDNQKLQFLQRSTVENLNYRRAKVQASNGYTAKPVSGDGGSLDKYTFLKSVEKDTVTIYIDIYNKGKLKIPVGLKYQ
ncbi:MAG: hypothetical protein WD824_03230 [Cyclobacteriaceae bacterium]